MEVHHHSHTERKKWTHYFWEFLMLFLAVFCGFLAEYQLEHKIERDREKQYMRSMLKDLGKDIINIDISIAQKNKDTQIADSLMQLFSSPDYRENTNFIYFLARRFSISLSPFYLTDGTLTQLKNSGGLRLIHNQPIVDSLQAYVNLYRAFEEIYRILEEDQLKYYRDVMIQVFDVKTFDSMIKSMAIEMPNNNPKLFDDSPALINSFLMRVHLLKRNRIASINYLVALKEKANDLLLQIKQGYRLK